MPGDADFFASCLQLNESVSPAAVTVSIVQGVEAYVQEIGANTEAAAGVKCI